MNTHFFKFLQSSILVLFRFCFIYFRVATLLDMRMLFFPTEDQVADIFTKSLTEAKFSKLRYMLGVQEAVIKGG